MPHQKNLQLNFAQHHAVSVQLNLSTTATLGTDKSGHCREAAVVQRLKQEWMYMYGLSAKKQKAVVERWPLVAVRLYACCS